MYVVFGWSYQYPGWIQLMAFDSETEAKEFQKQEIVHYSHKIVKVTTIDV